MDNKKINKYRDIIDNARSIDLRTLKTLNSILNLKENPFSLHTRVKIEEYFINREEIIESLIYELGIASRGIHRDSIIVSPIGFGKTTLIRYISFILSGLSEKKAKNYHFHGFVKSAKELFSKIDESEESLQLWVTKSKEVLDYIIIDDVSANHARTILREFTRTKLRVLVISPIDFQEIYGNMTLSPQIYYLNTFNLNEVIDMLDRRIRNVQIDQKMDRTIFELFDSSAIETIFKFTKGIPHLVIECARASLELLQSNMNFKQVGVSKDKFIVDSDIALQACRITGCFKAFTEYFGLGKAKKTILKEIMNIEKTPSEISEKLNKDRTTISRHLSDLKELGLIEYNHRGREILYQATIPSRILMEIDTIPDGESKFGTN